jgi:PII-like signaling protein
MAIVAQMMGGQRAGTSLLSLRSQMTGAMLKRSAQAMQDYGLLKEGEWSSEGGHPTLTDEASHRLLSLVNRDPLKFVNDLVDKLEAKGITNKDDQMIALQRILGRQTTQRMVADMLLARKQIERETEGLEQGATVSQGLSGYDKNIHASQQAMGAAWHNLIVAIGGPEGEHFASFLNKITGAINSVTSAVNKLSPDQIDLIIKIVAGIGAGLVVLGGIALTALVGLPAIIAGVVAAIATLAVLEWQKIKDTFNGIKDAISSFIDSIVALYNHAKDSVANSLGIGGSR